MTAEISKELQPGIVVALRQGFIGKIDRIGTDRVHFAVSTGAGVHLGHFESKDVVSVQQLLKLFPNENICERACIDLCLYFNFYCGIGRSKGRFFVTIDTEDEMGEHSKHSNTFHSLKKEEAFANALQYIQKMVN